MAVEARVSALCSSVAGGCVGSIVLQTAQSIIQSGLQGSYMGINRAYSGFQLVIGSLPTDESFCRFGNTGLDRVISYGPRLRVGRIRQTGLCQPEVVSFVSSPFLPGLLTQVQGSSLLYSLLQISVGGGVGPRISSGLRTFQLSNLCGRNSALTTDNHRGSVIQGLVVVNSRGRNITSGGNHEDRAILNRTRSNRIHNGGTRNNVLVGYGTRGSEGTLSDSQVGVIAGSATQTSTDRQTGSRLDVRHHRIRNHRSTADSN